MESYKHSCPCCGQHIEYTAGYCGKQIQCPICGNAVTFPAIPPGRAGGPIRTVLPKTPAPRAKWMAKSNNFLKALENFGHWKTVLACLVPFVIIGGLLLGASVVKKQFGDEPAAPATVATVDPHAYQKMADLSHAEQAVQQQLNAVIQARVAALTAQHNAGLMHNRFHGTVDPVIYGHMMVQIEAADKEASRAQEIFAARRQAFEQIFENYQKLGGTVDYRSRVPN